MSDQPIDLNAILGELREISERLTELPNSAGEERKRLTDRRRQLRHLAARSAPESRESLLHQLADLRRRRNEILDLLLSVGHIGHAHAGGLDARSTREFNREVDESWGRPEIERRIEEIRRQLDQWEE